MGRKSLPTEALIDGLPTLDPKEAKKQRRLIRNRLSAQQHRERQRAYMSGLQKQVAALTAERDMWRDALDTLAAKVSLVTGEAPEDLLGDLQLPLPAEKLAPAPPAPTGQASRSPDSSDVMADLLGTARSGVLPKGKPAVRAVVAEAASRVRAVIDEEAGFFPFAAKRPSKRRASRLAGDASSEDSDTTHVTARRPTARHPDTASSSSSSSSVSAASGEDDADDEALGGEGTPTDLPWEAATGDDHPRRRSTRASKRAALATAAAVAAEYGATQETAAPEPIQQHEHRQHRQQQQHATPYGMEEDDIDAAEADAEAEPPTVSRGLSMLSDFADDDDTVSPTVAASTTVSVPIIHDTSMPPTSDTHTLAMDSHAHPAMVDPTPISLPFGASAANAGTGGIDDELDPLRSPPLTFLAQNEPTVEPQPLGDPLTAIAAVSAPTAPAHTMSSATSASLTALTISSAPHLHTPFGPTPAASAIPVSVAADIDDPLASP